MVFCIEINPASPPRFVLIFLPCRCARQVVVIPVNWFRYEPTHDKLALDQSKVIIDAAAIICKTGCERLVAEMDSR